MALCRESMHLFGTSQTWQPEPGHATVEDLMDTCLGHTGCVSWLLSEDGRFRHPTKSCHNTRAPLLPIERASNNGRNSSKCRVSNEDGV